MANLIEYIQSQIYENSTEDISGSIMQQVLTRMASDEGVVNVHTISGQTPFADYNNAQAARGAVPDGFKKLGLIITYKLSSGWYIDEFIGSATSGWSTASNWKCLGPISVSQNASTGKTTITIGSESFDVATQPVSVSQNTDILSTDVYIGDSIPKFGHLAHIGKIGYYYKVWDDIENTGYLNSNGSITASYTAARTTDYIPIIPEKELFVYKPFVVDAAVMLLYDVSKTIKRVINASYKNADGNIIITPNSDEVYMRVSFTQKECFVVPTDISIWEYIKSIGTVINDNLPNGGYNILTGGQTFNVAKQTETQRAFAIEWYEQYSDIPNENGYITLNGGVAQFAGARYTDYIEIQNGLTYFVRQPFVQDNAGLAIYYADKSRSRTITGSDLINGNAIFTPNENEKYFRVSYINTGEYPRYISIINKGVLEMLLGHKIGTNELIDKSVTTPKLSTQIQKKLELFNSVEITTENTEQGYVNAQGTITSLSTCRSTDFISINAGISVNVYKPFVIDAAVIALYDENKGLTRCITATDVGNLPEALNIKPGLNEKFIRLSYTNSNIPTKIDFSVDGSMADGAIFDEYPIISNGYINQNGGITEWQGSFAYTDYIELPIGIEFAVINRLVDLASIGIYKSDKSFSRVITAASVSGQEYAHIKLGEDERFIRVTLYNTDGKCTVWFNQIVSQLDVFKRIYKQQTPIVDKQYNVVAAFDNVVCVGDSLTFSQVYTAASASRQAKRPYPTVLAKLCGNTETILARSGASAQSCWDEFSSQIVSKTNPLAIIYLGTNEGITDSLATDVVGDDPDEWANNNVGCYCRFVEKFQSLGYKVLLIRCWATSGTGDSNLQNTINAITHIAERFGCAVMDVPVSADLKLHYYPDLSGYNGVHYNDLGYSWFASAMITAISDLPTNQMKYIIPNA